ncbi:hypothetical protein [Micromonospora sp. WMMD812]|uniref:hypothetical protein n=1 Tax=Micromonospora sp. WMMD812 TaxID=3015152 RepID=UPI00248CDF20|nr:hypothetical protein [Micromonospora sp. WMMD812]WBB66910.1 hypothetical protein O7603_27915 [Micromonospora sp. WMMD812]
MSNSRYYGSGTEKALYMLSRGTCYAPKCKTRVLRMTESGAPRVNVQIAHICALAEGEARYDSKMSISQRNSFKNLILLCAPHHTEVDDLKLWEELYPASLLHEWKKKREGDLAATLVKLPPLDDELLQERMELAVNKTKEEIIDAIDQLRDVSNETLQLIKSMVSASFHEPYMSEEAIARLEFCARVFSDLEDQTWMLHESAQGLRTLEDFGSMLYESASGLRNAREYAPMLYEASRGLINLPDYVAPLREAAGRFELVSLNAEKLSNAADRIAGAGLDNLDSKIYELDNVADRLHRAIASAQGMGETARSIEQASDNFARTAGSGNGGGDWSWRAFRWGMFWCGFAVVAALGAWSYILIKQGA